MTNPTPSVSFLALAILTAGSVSTGLRNPAPSGLSGSSPVDYAAFLQACKDATTDALVINLAAHPDDEAGRSLVYLRRKYGIRTVTVYSTCGEGGQNAVGREIGMDLARIRTRETLAAARFTGTQVRWLGFADFGYSKTAAEAFKQWGKDRYVARLTEIIDTEQPDLVLTNHSPGQGHGHHRASVIALRELLEAKAKGEGGLVIPVYQRASRFRPAPTGARRGTGARGSRPQRTGSPAAGAGQNRQGQNRQGQSRPGQARQGRAGRGRAQVDSDIKFEVGEVDYITGLTYARQASLGWRQHRTQGMMGAFSSTRSRPDSWKMVHPKDGNGARLFSSLGSVFDDKTFQDVIDNQGLKLDAIRDEFDEFHKVRPAKEHVARARRLLKLLEGVGTLPDRRADLRLRRRIDALQRVILTGSGIEMKATLPRERLATGSVGVIDVVVSRASDDRVQGIEATLHGRTVRGKDGRVQIPFGPLEDVDAASVSPSWFRPQVSFYVDGQRITRALPVRYTAVPRVSLELERPVRFVPASAVGKMIEAEVQIEWNGDEALESALKFESSRNFDVKIAEAAIQLPARSEKTERVQIQLPKRALNGDESIVLALDSGKSELRLRPVDVKAPANLFIGLIRGPDDTLRLAMDDLNIRFEELGEKVLTKADFSKFTTIVIDIRAYRTRRDLRGQAKRILDWCEAGGRVLCFYHKPGEWNASDTRPSLAPFELLVGGSRVCEEDAPVELLAPEHRLWNHPNKIVPTDFDGWVQERGLNFPSKWDKTKWTPMMRMSDTEEAPLEGAMLYAKHGTGDYVYCSLALYRQLRGGHKGAARILVNLLTK